MPDDVLLRTEQLTRAFGSLLAVDRVDVSVRRGELRSIIGPNGAGKTTFFRLISGEMPPSRGRIWFDGRDITGMPQYAVARLGVAKSYQITNVFPHLTVLENVRVAVQGHARAYDFWSKAARLSDVRTRAEMLLERIGLGPRATSLAAHLSHGEKRHLEIGIALATDPALLLPRAGRRPYGDPGRAQDEGRHEDLGPHHGAAPGPGAGRGLAGGDPRQHPRSADVPGGGALT